MDRNGCTIAAEAEPTPSARAGSEDDYERADKPRAGCPRDREPRPGARRTTPAGHACAGALVPRAQRGCSRSPLTEPADRALRSASSRSSVTEPGPPPAPVGRSGLSVPCSTQARAGSYACAGRVLVWRYQRSCSPRTFTGSRSRHRGVELVKRAGVYRLPSLALGEPLTGLDRAGAMCPILAARRIARFCFGVAQGRVAVGWPPSALRGDPLAAAADAASLVHPDAGCAHGDVGGLVLARLGAEVGGRDLLLAADRLAAAE